MVCLKRGEDTALMNELIEEHKLGRRLTGELVEAKDAVVAGDTTRLADVISVMEQLVEFYPQHIEKEDKRFFPDTEQYYSAAELDAMIQSFYTFDMRMIHEKYGSVVNSLEHRG